MTAKTGNNPSRTPVNSWHKKAPNGLHSQGLTLTPRGVEQYANSLGNTRVSKSFGPDLGSTCAESGPNPANSPAESPAGDVEVEPTQPAILPLSGSTLAEAILAVQRLPLSEARKAEIIDQLCIEAETADPVEAF